MNTEQYLIAVNHFIYEDDLIKINIIGDVFTRYSEYYTWDGLVIDNINWSPFSSNAFMPYISGRIDTIKEVVFKTRKEILKMKAKRQIKRFDNLMAQKCMGLILQDRGVL